MTERIKIVCQADEVIELYEIIRESPATIAAPQSGSQLTQPEEEKVWSDPGPNIGPLVGRGSECMGTCAAARARRLIHIVCPPLTSLPVISRQKWESFDLCFNTNPPAGIP